MLHHYILCKRRNDEYQRDYEEKRCIKKRESSEIWFALDKTNNALYKVMKFPVKGHSMRSRQAVEKEKRTDLDRHPNLLDRYGYMTFDWVITVDEYTKTGDMLRQITRF